MCGRYVLERVNGLVDRFKTRDLVEQVQAGFNLAPQMTLPIIVAENGDRAIVPMRWGLVPSWAKEPASGHRTINARAETVAERPSFRGPLRYHRCLVPASGFYEWRKTHRGKQPYYIHLPAEPLFAFAGLYDTWHAPDGSELWTYTIITTEANALMAPIHDRMPVILPQEVEAAWLDPHETNAGEVVDLLQPYTASEMEAYPVSSAVNSVRNQGPELVERIGS
jgi:putative SOS response-associated peptidase YedK